MLRVFGFLVVNVLFWQGPLVVEGLFGRQQKVSNDFFSSGVLSGNTEKSRSGTPDSLHI